MSRIKSQEEIAILREAGKKLAEVLSTVEAAVVPGVSLKELDAVAEREIRARNATPAFLQYRPTSAPRPFPATLCVAVNDVVVHGIPTESDYRLEEGDVIGIDTGLWFNNLIVDSGRTVGVGKIDAVAQKLLDVTHGALMAGIAAAVPGNHISDIGEAIEDFVEPTGFSIVEELCGHGVGHAVHEDPQIPNFATRERGPQIVPGMVLAVEPMLNEGSPAVVFEPDGYTVRTRDGKRSAHFEHTIVITEDGNEILTKA